jgi:hypothetical protein
MPDRVTERESYGEHEHGPARSKVWTHADCAHFPGCLALLSHSLFVRWNERREHADVRRCTDDVAFLILIELSRGPRVCRAAAKRATAHSLVSVWFALLSLLSLYTSSLSWKGSSSHEDVDFRPRPRGPRLDRIRSVSCPTPLAFIAETMALWICTVQLFA